MNLNFNITLTQNHKDIDPQETQEWLESIDDALEEHGYERARFLLEAVSYTHLTLPTILLV